MEASLETPLRLAVSFLEKNHFRYALIGGLALSQWGIIRATHDVDIKVLVPDTNYALIRSALRDGFPTPARVHLPKNPLIVAVMIENVIVDFLLAMPGYEEQIIERAVRGKVGGIPLWICSAEDLIVQKAIAGRGKDMSDISELLIQQRGKLDYAYIEDWVRQFAELLELPEMLAQYRALVEKARR